MDIEEQQGRAPASAGLRVFHQQLLWKLRDFATHTHQPYYCFTSPHDCEGSIRLQSNTLRRATRRLPMRDRPIFNAIALRTLELFDTRPSLHQCRVDSSYIA
jgi:hypothetical protein